MAIVVMNEVVSHFMSLSPTPASSPISTAMWALHIAAKFGINNYDAAAEVVETVLNSDPSLTQLRELLTSARGSQFTEPGFVVEKGLLGLSVLRVCKYV